MTSSAQQIEAVPQHDTYIRGDVSYVQREPGLPRVPDHLPKPEIRRLPDRSLRERSPSRGYFLIAYNHRQIQPVPYTYPSVFQGPYESHSVLSPTFLGN